MIGAFGATNICEFRQITQLCLAGNCCSEPRRVKKELKIFATFVAIFLAAYLLPLANDKVTGAIIEAFKMLQWYARNHTLALLLAGPALSIPSILVIRSIIGNTKTFVFCILVVAMATVAGMGYGTVFPDNPTIHLPVSSAAVAPIAEK